MGSWHDGPDAGTSLLRRHYLQGTFPVTRGDICNTCAHRYSGKLYWVHQDPECDLEENLPDGLSGSFGYIFSSSDWDV